ncbi:hypothetical protein COC42_09065 [Sphingomonas spermidinifaciens]|uniref:STAS/SEC14 domain-containing protein n=1 Tax=Sphingomonas spermidinifaciens TaxID=1141889 RepID=A0A2A4B9V0_9SPHN|nr:hypothetical protein [Sphingomonas spermidinifaciens]PCD04404.1 hypothetical protein COC42_09065 [Sphingomonas spermidinifaciens]
MYRYCFDKPANLLDIEWRGLFDAASIAAYDAALRADFAAHGFEAGYRVVIDMAATGVQPQEALLQFRTTFADFPRASRIAVVTRSALHRLQIQRELPFRIVRIVSTREAALAWAVDAIEPDQPALSSLPRLST